MVKKEIIFPVKGQATAVSDNLLAVSVFFLPLYSVVSLFCWGLLLVMVIITGEIRELFIRLRSYPALILFSLLFILYLAGMLWTEHFSRGLEDLEKKILLIIFPVLFSTLNFSSHSFRKISLALIFGCVAALIICLINSFILYSETGDPRKFFYVSFSILLHPTYFTMFLNLAILMICQNTFRDEDKIFDKKWISVSLFIFLTGGVILLNARLAMITVFLTVLIFAVAEAIRLKKLFLLFPRFILQAGLVVIVFFTLIQYNNRFVQISDAIQDKKDTTAVLDTTTHVYYNSTTIRIALLKNSLNVFQDNFLFGTGTGDVIPESVAALQRSGHHYLAAKFTGAHTQYLQTAMTLGIAGLLLLLAAILFPLKDFIAARNWLGICFVIIVFFNAMGDTILRASSLYFFSFFGCYLYVYNRRFVLN